MGLINNDLFVAWNGVEKSGTYVSFSAEAITLHQKRAATAESPATYNVHANYRIFWDKAAKDAGKTFMELRRVEITVTEAELSANLYGLLYAELKKTYPNAVDA
jgi:hypothetical protein